LVHVRVGLFIDFHASAPAASGAGLFGRSALFFLGAGEAHPSLHNPDYDFPDDLIPIGVRVFALGRHAAGLGQAAPFPA